MSTPKRLRLGEKEGTFHFLSLSQDTFYRIGVLHSGQALLQTLEGKGKLMVIDAHAMKDGRIQLI